MPVDYLPPTYAGLADWSTNFRGLITAGFATYGLTTGQQAAYATLDTAFQAAQAVVMVPGTNTKVTRATRKSTAEALVANARLLANVVQSYPLITPTLLAALGLTVRTVIPTPIPAPTSAPVLGFISIGTNSATIGYHDELTPLSKAKPAGTLAIQLWTKTGATPPVSIDDCAFRQTITKSPTLLDFSGEANGTRIWFIGRYVTRKGLVGPESGVISTNVAA